MDQPALLQAFLISALAVASVVLLNRLRFPVVTGLMLAGTLMGPYGLGLLRDLETLRVLSDAGVVMLLFTVGLEVDPKRLKALVRPLLVGGIAQCALVTACGVLVGPWLGLSPVQGLLMGGALALSSSAVVLPILSRQGSLETPSGQQTLGVLLFQDLAFIPLMLLVSLLGGSGGTLSWSMGLWLIVGSAVAIAGGIFLSRVLLPFLLERVDATRSRDVFLLAVLAICLGMTWLTSSFGLSSALGAFLAGIVLAGTDYAHRALGDVLPLRGLVTSLFFVSLGTLFEPAQMVREPVWVLGFLAFLVLGKTLLAFPAALLVGGGPRVALLTSLRLAQFSELGFVLVGAGLGAGLLPGTLGQAMLAAGSLSLLLAPLVLDRAESLVLTRWVWRLLHRLPQPGGAPSDLPQEGIQGHVLIIGYGASGRFLAWALSREGVPYRVLELNAKTVRQARKAREPVIYADATRPDALKAAGVQEARAVVILINDYQAVRRIVPLVRGLAPGALVLARTRYLVDRSDLEALGAHRVVTEELEGGIAMLGEVLRALGLPDSEVSAHQDHCRRSC
ncbi:MAG TPA: cation:proton antiporter [Myxococcota bacterium]|nr:cation:proton antiporter [Myxococcota bacterium]HQK51483.1 cation:proton antiporter [Myxococcota bacterium]